MSFVILIGFSLCNFKAWDDVAFNFNGHMNFQAFIVILPKQINEFLFFSIRNFFFVMALMNGNILCGSHVTTEEHGPRNPQHRLLESRISQCKTGVVDLMCRIYCPGPIMTLFSFKQKITNTAKSNPV